MTTRRLMSSLTRGILEHLAEGGKVFLEVFFPPGYSYTDPSRRMFGLDRSCRRHRFDLAQKRSVSTILSRLRKEGLVVRSDTQKKSSWGITRKGRERIRLSMAREPLRKIDYVLPEKDKKLRIVVFDIPERERRKRDWLRMQLSACDFEPLQKSVWTGTRPLPEALIEEIDALDLGSHVHIMSIGEKGTLVLKNLKT